MTYKKRGVKKGYKHIWGYKGVWKEKKTAPKTWKIDFKATKGKKGSKTYGGFGKGTKILWKITGYQTARKTGKGTYQTRLRATKKLIKANIKNNKKRKRY